MNLTIKRLNFQPGVWSSLIVDLYNRGNGCRESGAFLLGQINATSKTVDTWLPYNELDRNSFNPDYVRLSTEAFAKLWDECAKRNLQVIADVHTHCVDPIQSFSDRTNPMISVRGHIAIIVPKFAKGIVRPRDVGVNIYLGGGRWLNYFGSQATALIKIL